MSTSTSPVSSSDGNNQRMYSGKIVIRSIRPKKLSGYRSLRGVEKTRRTYSRVKMAVKPISITPKRCKIFGVFGKRSVALDSKNSTMTLRMAVSSQKISISRQLRVWLSKNNVKQRRRQTAIKRNRCDIKQASQRMNGARITIFYPETYRLPDPLFTLRNNAHKKTPITRRGSTSLYTYAA